MLAKFMHPRDVLDRLDVRSDNVAILDCRNEEWRFSARQEQATLCLPNTVRNLILCGNMTAEIEK